MSPAPIRLVDCHAPRQEVEMRATRECATLSKTAISWIAAIAVVLVAVRAGADHAPHATFDIARGDGGDIGFSLKAEVDCSPRPGPGRVQCMVHLRPVGGRLHFSSDAIVLSAPSFAPPVR